MSSAVRAKVAKHIVVSKSISLSKLPEPFYQKDQKDQMGSLLLLKKFLGDPW